MADDVIRLEYGNARRSRRWMFAALIVAAVIASFGGWWTWKTYWPRIQLWSYDQRTKQIYEAMIGDLDAPRAILYTDDPRLAELTSDPTLYAAGKAGSESRPLHRAIRRISSAHTDLAIQQKGRAAVAQRLIPTGPQLAGPSFPSGGMECPIAIKRLVTASGGHHHVGLNVTVYSKDWVGIRWTADALGPRARASLAGRTYRSGEVTLRLIDPDSFLILRRAANEAPDEFRLDVEIGGQRHTLSLWPLSDRLPAFDGQTVTMGSGSIGLRTTDLPQPTVVRPISEPPIERVASTGYSRHHSLALSAPRRLREVFSGGVRHDDGREEYSIRRFDFDFSDLPSSEHVAKLPPIPVSLRPSAIALSPDGGLIAVGDDQRVAAIRFSDGQELWTSNVVTSIERLRFSPDGTKLIVLAKDHRSGPVIDTATGNQVYTEHGQPVMGSRWFRNDRLLVEDQKRKFLRLVELSTDNTVSTLDWPRDGGRSCVLSDDGAWLAVDGRRRLYRIRGDMVLPAFAPISQISAPLHDAMYGHSHSFFIPGRSLAVVGSGTVLDYSNPHAIRMAIFEGPMPDMADAWTISPDGATLAFRNRLHLYLLDLDELQRRVRAEGTVMPDISAPAP